MTANLYKLWWKVVVIIFDVKVMHISCEHNFLIFKNKKLLKLFFQKREVKKIMMTNCEDKLFFFKKWDT
jgi:hypothetical protein